MPKGVRWASYHHFHDREGVKPRGVGRIRYLRLAPFSERACSAQSSKVTGVPWSLKKNLNFLIGSYSQQARVTEPAESTTDMPG